MTPINNKIALATSDGAQWWAWLTPVALSIILTLSSLYSFLLFHTLAEFFAITVAILLCVVIWQTYPFTKNNFLMYLGCGYFWIAMLDMMHALSYSGMSIFRAEGANTSTQLWIVARYFEALVLLTAPIYISRKLDRVRSYIVFGCLAVSLFAGVLLGFVPVTFVEGEGLTSFKVVSEYIIVTLLVAALFLLIHNQAKFDLRVVRLMKVSILLTICAELAFTLYASPFGVSNLLGHLFKLFSFWIIFVAIVRTTLKEPFTVMAREATTYDAIPAAAIVVDQNNTIRQANSVAYNTLPQKGQTLIGKNVHEICHPKIISQQQCPVCQAAEQGTRLNMYELEVVPGSVWFDYTLSPVRLEDDKYGVVQVIRDISDRKRIEAELEQHRSNLEDMVAARTKELAIARDEALVANRTKSRFLASMSHELRTPLNSIIGFAGVIKSGMAGEVNDTQKKQLSIIYSSAQHLLGLINDILDLSKVEAGKMQVSISSFALSDLLQELEVQMSILFQEKGISLHIQSVDNTLLMKTDRVKLYQILTNLLSNALKFTNQGNVGLYISQQSSTIDISIKDTGIGIDEAHLKVIFETFRQVDGGQMLAAPGTGLGLAISRSYAALLGGRLSVESSVGVGSTFTLQLPYTRATEDSLFDEAQAYSENEELLE